MARVAGTKSTIEVGVNDLFTALEPFKGTPLKVQVGTAWANSLRNLGIKFGAETESVEDSGEDEGGETEVAAKPKFDVA